MNHSPEVEKLLGRAAIHDVLMRYFSAADRADPEAVRSCFTEDAHAHYHGREPVHGADTVVAQIALFRNMASGACKIATHFVGNLQFKMIEGDWAETEANAFAFLVGPVNGADQVIVRSLRYLDRWQRTEGRWKIAARVHTLDWSSEMSASLPAHWRNASARCRRASVDPDGERASPGRSALGFSALRRAQQGGMALDEPLLVPFS